MKIILVVTSQSPAEINIDAFEEWYDGWDYALTAEEAQELQHLYFYGVPRAMENAFRQFAAEHNMLIVVRDDYL